MARVMLAVSKHPRVAAVTAEPRVAAISQQTIQVASPAGPIVQAVIALLRAVRRRV